MTKLTKEDWESEEAEHISFILVFGIDIIIFLIVFAITLIDTTLALPTPKNYLIVGLFLTALLIPPFSQIIVNRRIFLFPGAYLYYRKRIQKITQDKKEI